MTRRNFQELFSAGILGSFGLRGATESPMIRPDRVKAGDKIGLIAPGSPIPPERIDRALETCSSLGLQAVLGKHVTKELGFLAGTDTERLEDLHRMFEDPEIKGIWCLRGGYGCSRLLPLIDYGLVAKNPKIFAGYSDITALHLAFYERCRLVTYHSPVATSDPTPYTIEEFRKIITGSPVGHAVSPTDQATGNIRVFREGMAEGILLGGNLSLLSALAGTPWSPSYRDKLVFIEDIGEKPYRIDRMLVQLFQATDLGSAAGFLLGQFADCEAKPGEKSLTLEETLKTQFGSIGVPVLYGFSFGHIPDQCTLPLGIKARLDTGKKTLTFLETP